MKIRSIAIGILAASAIAGPAKAENWDFGGGTTDWADPANWNPNTVPVAPNNAVIQNFSLAQSPVISGATSATVNELFVGQQFTSFLTINTTGTVTANRLYTGVFTNGNGTTIQNAGTVVATDFALGFDNNSKGTYNLTGGSLQVSGATTLAAGNQAGNEGVFNQSGGTFTAGSISVGSDVAARNGTLTFSDAAVANFSNSIRVGLSGGTGQVVLDGSKTGAGTNVSADQLQLGSLGTLVISIDDDAIADPSDMRSLDTVNSTFSSGSFLDLGFSPGSTPTSGTWTILTASVNINDLGIVLNPLDAAAGWSFNVNTGPGPDSLTVTYTVPEPSSIALLGATGTILMAFRRRKAARC
jgi:hypothetical protein